LSDEDYGLKFIAQVLVFRIFDQADDLIELLRLAGADEEAELLSDRVRFAEKFI